MVTGNQVRMLMKLVNQRISPAGVYQLPSTCSIEPYSRRQSTRSPLLRWMIFLVKQGFATNVVIASLALLIIGVVIFERYARGPTSGYR